LRPLIRSKRYSPRKYTCPYCGVKWKRARKWTKRYRDIALGREAYLDITCGMYLVSCTCINQTHYVGETPWAPKGGHYTYAVHEAVIKGLVRDRMSYSRLQQRMREDYLLEDLSLSSMFRWFNTAAEQSGYFRQFEAWTREQFSGVVCIDEVYENDMRIFMATDCLNDLPLCYMLSDKADEQALNRFLALMDERGLKPEIAITDGSPLYRTSLQDHWQGLVHQLCIFHVLNGFNKVVVNEVRALRRRLSRQGNKGRKRKRGRPSKQAQYQRKQKTRRKEEAKFIWDYQYLLVKKRCHWNAEDRAAFKRLCDIQPSLRTLRDLVERFHGLFERDISKSQARYRRTRLLNDPDIKRLGCFRKIARMIFKEKFEKMIAFLDYENVDRTSNHVERINRSFRMMQKTRYKRRTVRTIENAIRHEWVYLMKHHPLYTDPPQETQATAATFLDPFQLRKSA
jgi:hypothetical protein